MPQTLFMFFRCVLLPFETLC